MRLEPREDRPPLCPNLPIVDRSSSPQLPIEPAQLTDCVRSIVREELESIGRTPPQPLALRPKDAAKALGIGERLLWSWTNQNLIPHLRIGRAVIYPISELQQWMAEQSELSR